MASVAGDLLRQEIWGYCYAVHNEQGTPTVEPIFRCESQLPLEATYDHLVESFALRC